MINITIIDDDREVLKLMHKCVRESVGDKKGISVAGYQQPGLLLKEMDKRKCHILISDIDMPKMNGLEVAKRVKEANPRVFIIFVTAYMQYAIDSYRMDAFQYVLKTELQERLPGILCRLTDMIERNRKKYCFIGTESQKEKVFVDDIIWIKKEKNAKYVTYILEKGNYTERTSLEKAVERLSDSAFVIVERGCAVNLRHVMGIRDCSLYLSNQDTVIISKERCVGVKEKLHRFWREEEW